MLDGCYEGYLLFFTRLFGVLFGVFCVFGQIGTVLCVCVADRLFWNYCQYCG